MNIRKITHNRRRQRIGNLVTGVLNHFGKSTEENLTETVLNYSTQPREYVEFAVRRTLNCGVRQGFLVKTGRNTFDVPHHPCETDSGEAKQSDIPKTMEQRYTSCCNKHNATSQNCAGLDLITNGRCTLLTTRTKKHCFFHSYLRNLYDYAIYFVSIINQKPTQKCLSKYYTDYEELREIFRYQDRAVYQARLVRFLQDIKEFYVNGKGTQQMMDMFSNPLRSKFFGLCHGINISDENYNDCGRHPTVGKTCEEHHFYLEILRGFSRSPKYYGTNYDGKAKEKTNSFADGSITTTLLPRKPHELLYYLTRTVKCAYECFATITRYHRLKLTGRRLTDDYRKTVIGAIRLSNRNADDQVAGQCYCLNLPAVFKKFADDQNWPKGTDFVALEQRKH